MAKQLTLYDWRYSHVSRIVDQHVTARRKPDILRMAGNMFQRCGYWEGAFAAYTAARIIELGV